MGPVTDVPLLDRGSPETEQGPAVANPRIRVCSTVVFSAASGHARSLTGRLASEPIGRRTLMPHALETGHESGQMQTDDTVTLARESATLFGRSEPAEQVCGFLMTEDLGHHQRRLAL